MSNKRVRLSKFLACVLRHQPTEHGLQPNEYGFVSLDDLWQVIETQFEGTYNWDDLEDVVEGDARGKKRYEILGNQIRAMYGHSNVAVSYSVIVPPAILYHGTNEIALKSIQMDGLTPQSRQYVHLTSNQENAIVVASRKTQSPIMLAIRALEAHQAGIIFHQPEAEHFLAKHIPAQFIDIQS